LSIRLGPRGLDITYGTRRAFDLDLESYADCAIDFDADIPPDLARRIKAAVGGETTSFRFVELRPDEAERLARAAIQKTPNGIEAGIPIINAYSPRNGLLVPIGLIRQRLSLLSTPTQKGSAMSHALQRSAPIAYDLLKDTCDDPDRVIDEVILYELARAQDLCKRIDHIRGNKPPRATTLTEAEIDAVAKLYAAEIARRKVSTIREPLINPLPDGAFAFIPLLGQSDEANVVLFAAFIGHDSTRLSLDIDEVLPAISRQVVEGLGLRPKADATE
jgi:hypothetical protein